MLFRSQADDLRIDPQVISLHLQTPRSQRLRFVSGQSVTLTLGGDIRKTLPIASCPCDDRNLFFHIPDLPGDPFCEAVHTDHVSPRDVVQLEGPLPGDFFLDTRDDRPSLFLCWHTGFAPAISLIEHAMSLEIEQDIVLLRFSPTPDSQYLANLCRSWADAFDSLHVELRPERITLLTGADTCQSILENALSGHAGLDTFNVYVSGPPNFTDGARKALAARGVPEAQVKVHVDWMMALS